MSPWVVRRLAAEDRPEWERLFSGYCAFQGREVTAAHLQTVWSWIDEGRIVALVAAPADGSGQLGGLAHLREYVRPVAGVVAGFLDDLFVEETSRGSGAVDALIDAVRDHAAGAGWERVRWITTESNYRARAVYDRVATRTALVTYDLTDYPRDTGP